MPDDSAGDWPSTTVADVIKAHFSGPSPDCEERNIQSEAEWGLLKTTAITWSGWNESAHKVPPRSYWGQLQLQVEQGDVLVTKAGPRNRVGVVVHVPRTRPRLMVSGKMVGLRPDRERVVPTILAGLLSLRRSQKFLDHRATGMAESQVNFANQALLQTPICLPPLHEQCRIAEVLDTLDEATKKTEQVIAKLKQMKQGLLHDLLTRGVDENGELRDPERHPEQFKETAVGRIPAIWEPSTLESLTSRIVDGVHHTPTYTASGVPFLTVENLTRGPGISLKPCRFVSARAHAEYKRRADPTAGDVLVSKDGTLGVARVVPNDTPEMSIFVSVAMLRPRLERVLPELVCSFFDTRSFSRQLGTQSAGTGLKHIHLEHFRKFVLAVPGLPEQRRIFAVLNAADTDLAREDEHLDKLLRVKAGLSEDLLTGRVRVTKQLEGEAA